jgi:single-strand DNA-binding protein
MLNHIVVMGRLTRDPEIRYTQSQLPVTSFTVAVDRDFGGRDGGEKQTDFIDCVAWRNTAEFVSKYFTKGSMAVVSGRLQIRDWTDREGNKRRSAEIVADNVYFGESKRAREENSGFRPADGGYRQQENNGYRGGNDNNSYRSFDNAGAGNGFSELSDTDGELPF